MSNKLTSSDIIQKASPALVSNLLGYLFDKEKPLYKATIEAVAKQRKLRPIFIERKARVERFAWLQEALGRRASEPVAGHILQIWLVGQHSALLCDFLDALGIKHDENGTVEQLPEQPTKEALTKAVDTLFEKHDPETIAVYLHAFQALNDTGWTTLDEVLQSDERLQLGKVAPVS